ncbi:MAG: hypothetical protein JWO15_3370 [Sphingomonadales bacterium]|nr:hypothetical protein [Sphingomonadales bacterium]
MKPVADFSIGERSVTLATGHDALWMIIRRDGRGGVALRAAHLPGGTFTLINRKSRGATVSMDFDSAIGRQSVVVAAHALELPVIRVTTEIVPATDLLVPFFSRDVYPLDKHDDPIAAKGRVEAAQRGLNAGIVYFHLDEPAFGNVLYFQNFTALNPYLEATDTTPDGSVGGEWPEIGFLPPTPPQSGTPPTNPLPKGKPVTLTDAVMVFQDDGAGDEQESARRFLQMLGVVYRQIDLPKTEFRDWVDRAGRTLHDLDAAPEATIRHYGNRYVHPYTDAEYPDIMVQMSIVAAIHDFGIWQGKPHKLEAEFARGLNRFHDAKLKTMRRYLPNVGKDKDAHAVDSWYLYHPLLNLGRLALDGDKRCKRLFLGSLDLAIRAAHHFKYAWPIQFKVDDFSVIVEARNDDGLGQTDVGGLYAYVMLQAHELTDEPRYIDEARKAIDAVDGMRFELNYQANLTAWGAAACMRLWRITNEKHYLAQSYVYLASFFHNTEFWESELKAAKHYHNFLGVTCLHDAPYMAIYECFDSFTAFECYLKDSGPELEPAARMLVSEYCKYALHRAWFYYPDALPADILATEIRNGHIDRKLSFPMEDLYADGQPPGQVGQEIYGSGAAMVFASSSFHNVSDAPFRLFCDHFLLASERTSDRSLSFQLGGGDSCEAGLSVIRLPRQKLPKLRVETADGDQVRPHMKSADRIDFRVPANGRLMLHWGPP